MKVRFTRFAAPGAHVRWLLPVLLLCARPAFADGAIPSTESIYEALAVVAILGILAIVVLILLVRAIGNAVQRRLDRPARPAAPVVPTARIVQDRSRPS